MVIEIAAGGKTNAVHCNNCVAEARICRRHVYDWQVRVDHVDYPNIRVINIGGVGLMRDFYFHCMDSDPKRLRIDARGEAGR